MCSIQRLSLAFGLLTLLALRAGASTTREVAFEGDGVSLKGTVYLPDGKGPFPAVAVCQGSGPETRGSMPMVRIATLFADHGIACLVYDKRGCGESTGSYSEYIRLDYLAGDLLAGVKCLKSQPEVDSKHIGVFGPSQGGWVGPIAASKSRDISFVIALSGPSVSPQEQSLYERAQEMLDDGISANTVNNATKLKRIIWRYYGSGEGYAEADSAWKKAQAEDWFKESKLKGDVPKPEELKDPSYDYFRNSLFDPEPVLRNLQVPTLALFGDKDRHIPVLESVSRWQKYFEDRPSLLALKVFPGAGHGLQVVEDKEPLRESQMDHSDLAAMRKNFRLVPGFPEFLIAWVKSVTQNASR